MDKINRSNESTIQLLINIWKYLKPRRRFQIKIAIFIMISSGISEIFTLASVFPFLSVLTEPSILNKYELVRNFSLIFNIDDPKDLIPSEEAHCQD